MLPDLHFFSRPLWPNGDVEWSSTHRGATPSPAPDHRTKRPLAACWRQDTPWNTPQVQSICRLWTLTKVLSWTHHANWNTKTPHSVAGLLKRNSKSCNKNTRTTVGGYVAQLIERRTGTPPTQVWFPGAARAVQTLLRCPYTPLCNNTHLHLYASWRSRGPCQSSVDYERHRKQPAFTKEAGQRDSVAADFPRGRQPDFSMGQSPWVSAVVKTNKQKQQQTSNFTHVRPHLKCCCTAGVHNDTHPTLNQRAEAAQRRTAIKV